MFGFVDADFADSVWSGKPSCVGGWTVRTGSWHGLACEASACEMKPLRPLAMGTLPSGPCQRASCGTGSTGGGQGSAELSKTAQHRWPLTERSLEYRLSTEFCKIRSRALLSQGGYLGCGLLCSASSKVGVCYRARYCCDCGTSNQSAGSDCWPGEGFGCPILEKECRERSCDDAFRHPRRSSECCSGPHSCGQRG